KYGEFVRVVEIDDFSRELCGGTHVSKTSEIGIFKILSEGSVGANVRRIEAVTGRVAVAYFRERDALVKKAADLLGIRDSDLLSGLERLLAKVENLEKEVQAFLAHATQQLVEQLVDRAERKNGISVVADIVEARDADHLLAIVDQVRNRLAPAAVALGSKVQGKGLLIVSVSREVSGLHAGDIVKKAVGVAGGGGGGSPQLGRGGGVDPSKLGRVVEEARLAILSGIGG
ncbi:MAG: DHHA1 domain-containing protein, partial [Anaerolineae bacterium]